ncbi:50S ribosomal protein L15e [Candidatus Woesearchaeota archaeon]|nr:50S ribosomal protein L15e [Candidatus Woesearchaeota archaeon]
MGLYKYIRQTWKRPKENLGQLWKDRLIEWRQEQSTVRIDKPTRIDRARSLGYKAKPGVIVVRQRVSRKGRMRPARSGGRRPKAYRFSKITNMNYRAIAEQRANKKYVNCEVLNSYYVAEDGKFFWYEVILVDKAHPQITSDKDLNFLSYSTKRAFRGQTSAGKKHRGLRTKGKGSEKLRPSASAAYRKKVSRQKRV